MAKYIFVVRKLYYATLEIFIGKYSHDVARIYLTIFSHVSYSQAPGHVHRLLFTFISSQSQAHNIMSLIIVMCPR
jgi:hypothetical protein